MSLLPLFNAKTKEAMLQALKKYKADTNTAKEFYPCTQVLTEWLNQQKGIK
jgi:hypothetical protein